MRFPRSGPSQTPARPPARLRECGALTRPALASLREAVCALRPRFRGDPGTRPHSATLRHRYERGWSLKTSSTGLSRLFP